MSDYLENAKKYKKYHYSVLQKSEIEYLHRRCLEMLDIVIEILIGTVYSIIYAVLHYWADRPKTKKFQPLTTTYSCSMVGL